MSFERGLISNCLNAVQRTLKSIFTSYLWNLLFFLIPGNYRIAILALSTYPIIQKLRIVNNISDTPDNRSMGIYIFALFLLTNFSLHPIPEWLCIATVAYHSLYSLYLAFKNLHDIELAEYHFASCMLMLIITCSFLPAFRTVLLNNFPYLTKALLFFKR